MINTHGTGRERIFLLNQCGLRALAEDEANHMNEIETLKKYLTQTYPVDGSTLTAPLHPDGIWSLDIDYGPLRLAIEWSEQTGFGVSEVDDSSYGQGPDAVYSTLTETKDAIEALIGECPSCNSRDRKRGSTKGCKNPWHNI